MNYEESMDFLNKIKQYGSVPGLDSIRRLMNIFGNIQDKLPVIHIAGTNGKGSISAMLESCFLEAGYHTGRFSTPDVFSFEEEFLLDGKPIEKQYLAMLFSKVKDACDQLVSEGYPHPTRFEVETAIAFLAFYEQNCEVVMLEVGMGGLEDATNIISCPMICVVASVSLDHTNFLGNTLSEIAKQKAGIIKKNVPVISVVQTEEVAEVLHETAGQKNSECYIEDIPETVIEISVKGTVFTWKKEQFLLSLIGEHQAKNAVAVLKVLELLQLRYTRLGSETLHRGLAKTIWPGRMECLGRNPFFYIDGAHNVESVKRLHSMTERLFYGRRIVYIMAVFRDKNYEEMCRSIFHKGDVVYTVTPPNPRGLENTELAAVLRRLGVTGIPCNNEAEAVEKSLAKKSEVILCFGTFSYLKNIKQAYNNRRK